MTAPEPTPTAATTGLTEVLAAHTSHLGWSGLQTWNAECLGCGWSDHGMTGGGVAASNAYNAHFAAVLAEWHEAHLAAHLAARLSDPDVVEAAERLVRTATKPSSDSATAHVRASALDELRAALAAATDALGVKP